MIAKTVDTCVGRSFCRLKNTLLVVVTMSDSWLIASSVGRLVDWLRVYIVGVHLSVSSRYYDTEGCERSESPRCLNSEETEQMYSKNRVCLIYLLDRQHPVWCLNN